MSEEFSWSDRIKKLTLLKTCIVNHCCRIVIILKLKTYSYICKTFIQFKNLQLLMLFRFCSVFVVCRNTLPTDCTLWKILLGLKNLKSCEILKKCKILLYIQSLLLPNHIHTLLRSKVIFFQSASIIILREIISC